MKVISVDNYDREHISDTLICENVSGYLGSEIVEFLNQKFKYGSDYYKLVDDDYKLWRGMEELI